MQTPSSRHLHSEAFLRSLMRRQFRLSAACAAVFLAALFGLPLANYFLPELMAKRVFGFTLSWLVLGVAFFPAVWVLSWWFIRRSTELEDDLLREAGMQEPAPSEAVLVRPAPPVSGHVGAPRPQPQ